MPNVFVWFFIIFYAPISLAQSNDAKFYFHSSVSYSDTALIEHDLQFLAKHGFFEQEPWLMEVLRIESTTPYELYTWLRERITVITGPNYEGRYCLIRYPAGFGNEVTTAQAKNRIQRLVESKHLSFCGSSVKDMLSMDLTLPFGLANDTTNLIQLIPDYITFKLGDAVVAHVVDDKIYSERVTQRDAIFKLSRSFSTATIDNNDNISDFDNLRSYANTANRIAHYFGEARRTDGNINSLGFASYVCGSRITKTDLSCDIAENGSYTIKALMLRAFLRSCSTCSALERVALAKESIRYFFRVKGSYQHHAAGRKLLVEIEPLLKSLRLDSDYENGLSRLSLISEHETRLFDPSPEITTIH